jgi:hypothetical protein
LKTLEGWVVALVGGQWFVGKPETNGILRPFYQLEAGMIDQGGRKQIRHMCLPPALLCSITEMRIPTDTPMIRIDTLSPNEQRGLAGAVENCEGLIKAVHAAENGGVKIIMPSASMKQ